LVNLKFQNLKYLEH